MDNRLGADAPPTDDADRASGSAQDTLGAMKDVAMDVAGAAKDAIKDGAQEAFSSAQESAAGKARTAAATLREASSGLDEELPWLAGALRKGADGIEHLSDGLGKGDLSTAMNAVSDFARRQPALFIGLSVAAGFALARVGKTAMEGAQEAAQPTPDAARRSADNAYPQQPGM